MRMLLGCLLCLIIGTTSVAAFDDGFDLPEKDEVRRSFTLDAGATIRLTDISGTAEIETHSGNTAEIHIVRSARNRSDLEHKKLEVVQTGSSLEVRGVREDWKIWRNHEVRQRIMMKVPRSVSLEVRDVSGKVVAGAIDGSLAITDVSGKVSVQGADGECTVADVSGKVVVNLLRLGASGMRIADVSGVVDVGLPSGTGAELTVRDISGKVSTDLDNLSVRAKGDGDEFDGTIGSGGPLISIMDVSGRVRISHGTHSAEK